MQPANPQQVCCTGGAPLRAKAGRSLCFLPALGARATLAGGGYRDYVIMLFIGSGLP
jgi:organic radical activating enzyme